MGLGGVQVLAPAQGTHGWYSGSAALSSPTATSHLSAEVDKQAGRQDCMDLLSRQLYMKEEGLRKVQTLLGNSWRNCTTSAHTQAARGQDGY